MTSNKDPDSLGMTAMEKVAWTEVLVAAATVAVVLAMIPLIGNGAAGGFGLLGAVAFNFWFIRRRGKTIIIDERDREIERLSRQRGVEAAWGFLVLALIVVQLGPWHDEQNNFTRTALNWLIWIQFAVFFVIKGLTGVILYRSRNHAS